MPIKVEADTPAKLISRHTKLSTICILDLHSFCTFHQLSGYFFLFKIYMPRKVEADTPAKLMSRNTKLSTICILDLHSFCTFHQLLGYFFLYKIYAEEGRGRHLCKNNVQKYKTKYHLYSFCIHIEHFLLLWKICFLSLEYIFYTKICIKNPD